MSKNKEIEKRTENLREDIEDIKTNVVGIAKEVKKEGREHMHDFVDQASENLNEWKARGEMYRLQAEKKVIEKPMQSLAIAFGAGILASILLGRR